MVRIKNGKKDVQQNYKKCNNEEFKTMQITWKSKVAIFEGVKCIRGEFKQNFFFLIFIFLI